MAMFKVDIAVGNPDGGDLRRAKAVVDAGADHSMLPAQLLGGFGPCAAGTDAFYAGRRQHRGVRHRNRPFQD